MQTNESFWRAAQGHLRRAGELIDLEPEIAAVLAEPMHIAEYRIPLRMDDGSVSVFPAFRVRHNAALGATKDGVRIRPDVDLAETKALAMVMTIKHSIAEIPAGGGKGGIAADPSRLSAWELERLCRAFIRRLNPRGAWGDVPGADIGTSAQTQAWMLDEYEQITGAHSPAAINDKPVAVGGSHGGEEATGRGVYLLTLAQAAQMGLEPCKTRVVVQGFGQVGRHAAVLLAQDGFRIVGVSDIRGGVYNPGGLDVETLTAHAGATGTVAGFPGGRPAGNDELLLADCEVLVPAAVHNVIHEANARGVRAKLIVEGANGPVTPAADEILESVGVRVVPDVLANAGGVIVCHFERIQGLTDMYWTREEVYDRLRQRLLASHAAVGALATELGVSMRLAAWAYGLRRVAEAIRLRGWG